MTNRKSEVSFDFAFVEDRILRAKRLLRKLVRVNRRNAAVKAKAFDCGIGQIIPRTDAFIGQMIDFPSAGFYPRQKLKNAFGEISGIAGAADLIENDFQFRPFERQVPNFLNKVFAKGRKQLCRPQHQTSLGVFKHGTFALLFGNTINIQRIDRVGFQIRRRFSAVKNIVGRHMNQNRAVFFGSNG